MAEVALLALVASYPVAAVRLLRGGANPDPTSGRGLRFLLAAILLVGLPAIVAEATFSPSSGESEVPLLFTLVPGASAAAVLALGPRGDRALAVAVAFALSAIAPFLAWRALPGIPAAGHCEGCWTLADGAPASWREAMRIRGGADNRAYPEGWLAESPVLVAYPREAELLGERIRRIRPHAVAGALQGIVGRLRLERTPEALWYPGGTVREALDGVAYRPVGP